MPSFSRAANVSGDWNTGTRWTRLSVSNTTTADVLIGATATLAAYTDSFASGETGAAAGDFSVSLQTYVKEVQGALDLDDCAATNSVYISNEIEALAGPMTIGAPIREVSGNTPTDGMFNLIVSRAVIRSWRHFHRPDRQHVGRVQGYRHRSGRYSWRERPHQHRFTNERRNLASSLFGVVMLNPQAGSVSIPDTVSINDVIVPDNVTIANSDQVLTPVKASSRTGPS